MLIKIKTYMQEKTVYEWLESNNISKPYSERPQVDNHKHNCLGCSCEGRGWEAFRIFIETQLKRLLRLLTFFQTQKYFAHNENDNDIYKGDGIKSDEGDYIQNLGHATQLLRMNGTTILTDPVFANLNWLLYPSKTRPGLTVNELPAIDVIMISHNHRDHVDESSIKELINKYPDMKVFVPEGDRKLFVELGFKPQNVFPSEWYSSIVIAKENGNPKTKVYLPEELILKFRQQINDDLKSGQNWWDKKFGDQRNFQTEADERTQDYDKISLQPNEDKVQITALPSKHWSGRNGLDNGESATNGWIVSGKNKVSYFAGDTAMMNNNTIKQISGQIYEKLPVDFFVSTDKKVDLLLPDGPNYTRSHMEGTHMSIVDGLKMSLNIAKNLRDIRKYMGGQKDQITTQYWLDRCNIVMIHHNKYELGPDRFNEGCWVMKEVLKPALSSLDDRSLDDAKRILTDKENAENAKWSVFLRKNNDWVYKGLKELMESVEEILTTENNGQKATLTDVKAFIEKHIDSIKNPKIGERIEYGNDEKVTSFKSIVDGYE